MSSSSSSSSSVQMFSRNVNPSIWQKLYPRKFPLYPSLVHGQSTDVVIIGGGIVGSTCLYYMKQLGLRSILLEAADLGGGTTGYSTAKITSQHSRIYSTLTEKYGKDAAQIYAQMNETCINEYERIIQQYNLSCEWKRCSHSLYTEKVSNVPAILAETSIARSIGLPVTKIEPGIDLPYSIPVQSSLTFANQGQLNSYAFVLELVNQCVNSKEGGNCTVYENTRVMQIDEDPHNQSHQIIVNDGTVLRAKYVIIATHMPILDRAGYFTLGEPSRSYCIAMKLKEGNTLPDMYISIDQPTRSLRSCGKDGSILIVAGDSTPHGDETSTDHHYTALQEYAEQYFSVDPGNILAKWSAMDYYTADKLPYIGRLHKNTSSIFTTLGFSKWGLTTGLGASMIIRDLISGKLPMDPHSTGSTTMPTGTATFETVLSSESSSSSSGTTSASPVLPSSSSPYSLSTDPPTLAWYRLMDSTRWNTLQAAPGFVSAQVHTGRHYLGDKIKTLIGSGVLPNAEALLPGQGGIVKTLHGHHAGVYRDNHNQLHIVKPICTHLGCNVVWNSGEKTWDCPCHGSQFNVDGGILHGPACNNLPTYPNLDW